MPNYKVIVTVELEPNCSAIDAEIDESDLEPKHYKVVAPWPETAEEKALDMFHAQVPIGVLSNVVISTDVVEL